MDFQREDTLEIGGAFEQRISAAYEP